MTLTKAINEVYNSILDEAVKTTHAVIDPDGNILGFTSNDKDAIFMSKNNLRKVKGKVVTLKKPIQMNMRGRAGLVIGRPIAKDKYTEEFELEEDRKAGKYKKGEMIVMGQWPNPDKWVSEYVLPNIDKKGVRIYADGLSFKIEKL